MRHIQHSLLAVVISLSGCGAPVTQIVSSPQPVSAITEDVDLVPPVPTFLTFADCELAYGQGSCGTGAQIYTTANLAVPAGAATWYVPFAYGAMTGVLVNRYYGPPTVYVSSIPYRVFVSPVVVQRYRVVDTNVIEVFRRAPLLVRNETIMSGPVRFAPTRGVITSRPYAHPPDGHPSPTPADSQSRTRMPPVQTRTTVVPADSRDLSATPNTKSQAPQGQSTPRPAPAASLPQRPAGIQNPAVQAPTTQSPPQQLRLHQGPRGLYNRRQMLPRQFRRRSIPRHRRQPRHQNQSQYQPRQAPNRAIRVCRNLRQTVPSRNYGVILT